MRLRVDHLIGFIEWLTVVLVVIGDKRGWSLWWCFAPMWVPLLIVFGVVAVVFIQAFTETMKRRIAAKDKDRQ